jgi:hypothetical protein
VRERIKIFFIYVYYSERNELTFQRAKILFKFNLINVCMKHNEIQIKIREKKRKQKTLNIEVALFLIFIAKGSSNFKVNWLQAVNICLSTRE